MKLYVSGPMTGYEDYNFPAFDAAEKLLVVAGFEVENPASKGIIEGWSWADYLKYDIRVLLDCQGVALLDGWTDSRGARLEVTVAEELEIPVKMLHDWLA